MASLLGYCNLNNPQNIRFLITIVAIFCFSRVIYGGEDPTPLPSSATNLREISAARVQQVIDDLYKNIDSDELTKSPKLRQLIKNLYQNPDGRDRRPRWPRRGYELVKEIYSETSVRLGIKTKIATPWLSSIAPLGFSTNAELEFNIGRTSTLEIISNNINSLIKKTKAGEVVFTASPGVDTIVLCEEELYLKGIGELIGQIDVLGSRVEGLAGLRNIVKVTQTTGLLSIQEGVSIDYFRNICMNKFWPDRKASLISDLKLLSERVLTYSLDNVEGVCVVAYPTQDYLEALDLNNLEDYRKFIAQENPECPPNRFSLNTLGWGSGKKINRCVTYPNLPPHAGYCKQRATEGQPCSLYNNSDGSITERPLGKNSQKLTQNLSEIFCDEAQYLECQMVQKGGWFPNWYQVYGPYKGRCEKIPKAKLSQRFKEEEEIFRLSNQISNDQNQEHIKIRQLAHITTEQKLSHFFPGIQKFEASGVVFAAELQKSFVVLDNKKQIAVLSFEPHKGSFDAHLIPLNTDSQTQIVIPPGCPWCSGLQFHPTWRKLKGFEGISFDRLAAQQNRFIFYLAVESINVSDNPAFPDWMPAALEVEYVNGEPTGTFTVKKLHVLNYLFPKSLGSNNGLEGMFHYAEDDTEYLWGLCEGKRCSATPGYQKGGGQILVFKKNKSAQTSWWEFDRILELNIAPLKDYSGIDIRQDGKIAIVSQESSMIWLGSINWVTSRIEPQTIYQLPLSPQQERIYCNIEGVSWLSDTQLILVSDQIKGDQSYKGSAGQTRRNCPWGQQMVHIIDLK